MTLEPDFWFTDEERRTHGAWRFGEIVDMTICGQRFGDLICVAIFTADDPDSVDKQQPVTCDVCLDRLTHLALEEGQLPR